MEIIFTTANGQRILWDGLLWSSVDLPLVALGLNFEIPTLGGPHTGVLEMASRRLDWEIGRVTCEIVDETGWPEEYLGADVIFSDSELAEMEDLPDDTQDDSTTQSRVTQGTLAAAAAFLGESVCADETADGDADWEGPEREWAALTKWAEQTGKVLAGPGPEYSGGREHDVTYDPLTGCWIKFTKPDSAGFTVDWDESGKPYLRNALPSEYLERLRFQNELLEDRIELLGMWRAGKNSWSIVTRQPDVMGQKVTLEEIRSGMEAMGFVRLKWKGIGYEHSEAWRMGQMLLWDVHPANVVRFDSVIIPIDVIITPLPCGYAPIHFHDLEKLLPEKS